MAETLIAPAPGAEISLGSPKNIPASMPDSIRAAVLKAAGEAPDPEPPKDTTKAAIATPAPAKAQEKAPEKPAAPDKPADTAPKEPKALREAYDRATSKAEELSRSLEASTKDKADAFKKAADLEARLTEREKKIAEDYEPRVQRLAEREKRLQEVEEQLRVTNYMATPEFHEKYVKPISETQAEISELLGEMTATVDGTEVKATSEHFNFVLSAPSANEAARRAREMFGPDLSPQIVNFRQKLVSLDKRKQEAARTANLESIEFQKRNQSSEAQAREMLRSKIAEREGVYVADFAPPEDDPDLKAAFNEGKAFADEVAQTSPQTHGPDKFADTVAKARSHIMERSVLKHKLIKLTAENKALQEQLSAYHKSDPDVETRKGGKSLGNGEETFESKMMAAVQKHAAPKY